MLLHKFVGALRILLMFCIKKLSELISIKANLEGCHITFESIRSFLQEKSPNESFHLSTLARTLDRWGFEFGKGIRTQHLKEKDYIIVARQSYLRKMGGGSDFKHRQTDSS